MNYRHRASVESPTNLQLRQKRREIGKEAANSGLTAPLTRVRFSFGCPRGGLPLSSLRRGKKKTMKTDDMAH